MKGNMYERDMRLESWDCIRKRNYLVKKTFLIVADAIILCIG